MLKNILHFHNRAITAIEAGVETADIFKVDVREEIARAKYIPQEDIAQISKIRDTIDKQINDLQTLPV